MNQSIGMEIYGLIPYPVWFQKNQNSPGVFGELKFRMDAKYSHYQNRISPMKLLSVIEDGTKDKNGQPNEYVIALECTSNVNPNIDGWNWFLEHGKNDSVENLLKDMSESEDYDLIHVAIWPTKLCYLCEDDAAMAREAIESGQTPNRMTLHDALKSGRISFEKKKFVYKRAYTVRYDEFGENMFSENTKAVIIDTVEPYRIATVNESVMTDKLQALYDECRINNGYADSIIVRHFSECFETLEQCETKRQDYLS